MQRRKERKKQEQSGLKIAHHETPEKDVFAEKVSPDMKEAKSGKRATDAALQLPIANIIISPSS